MGCPHKNTNAEEKVQSTMLTQFGLKVFVDSQLDVTDKHTFSYENIFLPKLLFHFNKNSEFFCNKCMGNNLVAFISYTYIIFLINYLLLIIVRIHYLKKLTRKK